MGYTNLVDTDLTNWNALRCTPSPSGNDSYIITTDGSGSVAAIQYAIPSDSLDRSCRLGVRTLSGIFTSGDRMEFRDGVSPKGDVFNIEDSTSSYGLADIGVTSSDQTDRVYIRFNNTAVQSIEVRNMRAANSSAPVPAMPVGSAAGATVGTDLLSFTGDYELEGYIVLYLDAYGWTEQGNPVDAQPIFFQAGPLTLTLDASGFIATSGGAVSTIKPTSQHVIIFEWGNGNHTISVDDETPVVAASAIVPADGTSYLGNNSAATKVAHAGEACLINKGEPTAQQRTNWQLLKQVLEDIVFQ